MYQVLDSVSQIDHEILKLHENLLIDNLLVGNPKYSISVKEVVVRICFSKKVFLKTYLYNLWNQQLHSKQQSTRFKRSICNFSAKYDSRCSFRIRQWFDGKKRFHIVEGTQSNLSRITSKVTLNDLLRSAIIVKNRGKYQLKIAFLSIAS